VSTEIALALLAASIPLTALILRFASMVNPLQFVRLETQFEMFQQEVRKELTLIREMIEKNHDK
jgi:hypothetical protein